MSRVKELSGWITEMLDEDADDLCWFNRKGVENKDDDYKSELVKSLHLI